MSTSNREIYLDTVERSKKFPVTISVKQLCKLPAPEASKIRPQVTLVRGDCLALAQKLAEKGIKATVLNFANNDIPGGPTSCRGNTQEEQIFRRTNACLSLDSKLYPIDLDQKTPSLLVSDRVTVFKNAAGALLEHPFPISLITCAALRLPPIITTAYGTDFRTKADAAITEQKMVSIISATPDAVLILGAWGLGAFNGPLDGMARCWKRAIDQCGGESCPKHIIFAVFGYDKEEERDFEKAFACVKS